MANAQAEQCVFCQKAEATTRDHVPPLGLFPKPRPSNLVTVPACRPCNVAWAQDGEYFRAVICASANLADSHTAGRTRDVVLRSLRRDESQGFAKSIRGAFVDVELTSAGGIYLGQGAGIRVDLPRLHSVLQQTIRGLFFAENRQCLPSDFEIKVLVDQFGEHVRNAMRQRFGGKPKAPIRRFADVFEYAVLPVPNEPTSLWVGTFFQRVYFMGYITRMASEEGAQDS